MTPTIATPTTTATGMMAINPLSTVYATKRRRRNGKNLKPPPKDGVTKSNPSKRHRERLNAELDTLANLLPFEQNILSKLDRLSILRLSVSYLRTKSYFQVTMSKDDSLYRSRNDLSIYDNVAVDSDAFLQALNGFLVILTCEGEVFYATHTIENYLGFHQSDIVHQSVYELVHSEDREELQRQLMWNSFLPADQSGILLQDVLQPERNYLLERSFTVRFRCLLDNTSGFLRLDIRGRVKVLHGQNRKTEDPPLALFAICTPFGPPSLLEIPHKEVMFKSKHKLDLSLVSMDQRGKLLLGYTDGELTNLGGYDLVHYDDLAYVASAHQELLKTGASGMIAYRFQTKNGQWQWLQTSSRLVYKNSKPDFVVSTHRPLMEEEGRDLIGKRTMDFKVSYLDAGLNNSYFSDSDQLMPNSSCSGSTTTSHGLITTSASSSSVCKSPTPPQTQRVNRRYKTQLRDFLSTCRTKRKLSSHVAPTATPLATTHPTPASTPSIVEFVADPVAVAYSNLNSVYPGAYTSATGADYGSNFHQSLYDNRLPYLGAADNLFHQYRPLGNYYSDYAAAPATYVSNGFFELPRGSPSTFPTYEAMPSPDAVDGGKVLLECDKFPPCPEKYIADNHTSTYVVASNKMETPSPSTPYSSPSSAMHSSTNVSCDLQAPSRQAIRKISDNMNSNGLLSANPPSSEINHVKTEQITSDHYSPLPGQVPRQTVLMWALNHTPQSSLGNVRSPVSAEDCASEGCALPVPMLMNQYSVGVGKKSSYLPADPLKSLAEMNVMSASSLKWKPNTPPSPKYYQQLQLQAPQHLQYGDNASGGGVTHAAEVWPAATITTSPCHQLYSFHRHHTEVADSEMQTASAAVAAAGSMECALPQRRPPIGRMGVLCCPSRRGNNDPNAESYPDGPSGTGHAS